MSSRYPYLTAKRSHSGFGSFSSTTSSAVRSWEIVVLGSVAQSVSRRCSGRLASLALLTLERASPPPEVGDRAEDRAITIPGARGVAALLSPARLEEGQRDQAPVIHRSVRGISGRVRGVGLFRPLLKQLERLAILPGPLPQRRIRDRPRELQLTRVCPLAPLPPPNGSELLRRSPEIGEGILFVRNAGIPGTPRHRTGRRCPGGRSGC